LFYAQPNTPRDFLEDFQNDEDKGNKDDLAMQMFLDDDDDAKSDDSFKKIMREKNRQKLESKKVKETVEEKKEDEYYELLFKTQNSGDKNEDLSKNRYT